MGNQSTFFKLDKRIFVIAMILFLLFPALIVLITSPIRDHTVNLDKRIIKMTSTDKKQEYKINLQNVFSKEDQFIVMVCIENATIRAYDDSEGILYKYPKSTADIINVYGNHYAAVTIDSSAKYMRLVVEKTGQAAVPDIKTADAVRITDGSRYYIGRGSIEFAVGLLLIIIAFFAIPFLATIARSLAGFTQGLSLLFTCATLALMLLNKNGHYLVFFSNQAVWNDIGYICKYLLPIFVMTYYFFMEKKKFQRGVLLFCIIFNTVFTIVMLVMHYKGELLFNLQFKYFIPILIIDAACGTYGVITNVRRKAISKYQLFFLFSVTGALTGIILIGMQAALSGGVSDEHNILLVMSLVLFYVMISSYVLEIYSTIKRRNKIIEDLVMELDKSRTKVSMNQMQPHFVYNALASIREVVLDDPLRASDLIYDFTNHLRSVVRAMSGDKLISFKDELETIKAYVNIEQLRFGEKLKVTYDIGIDDFQVLALGIQPLVENAIRHGIYGRGKKGGTCSLVTREKENTVIVVIKDDGVGFDYNKLVKEIEEGKREAVGLRSVIFRAKQIMGAEVSVDSCVGVGTEIQLIIPKNLGEEE